MKKHLPRKPEDPSSNLQNIHKNWTNGAHVCKPNASMLKWEVETGESPEAHSLASIAHVIEKQ